MKRNITISGNRCRLFHDGPFKKHCKVCCMPSHITGDVSCPARNVGPPIVAFRSQNSVFSNFFKCDINVFDQKFISTEHAYQWKAATEAGMNELAEKIKKADHAGIAKSLSKSIPQANRIEWEKKNTDVMEEIIFAKAEQVQEFRQALLETDGDILAEATADTFWASGMPPDLTEITNPEYWPGMNMLGHIIMKVCKAITDGEKSHYDEQDHSNYLDNSTLVTATDERALTEVVVHSTPNTTGHISRKDIGSSTKSDTSGSPRSHSTPRRTNNPRVVPVTSARNLTFTPIPGRKNSIGSIQDWIKGNQESPKRKPSCSPENSKDTKQLKS